MKSLFTALLFLLLCSCSNGGMHRDIENAYALLNSAPDSAMNILAQIDRSSLSERERAQYALYYSIAQDKSGLDVDKDTLLRVAYDYFKHRPNDSLYAKSNYYMGLYYQLADSSKCAVDCFNNAIHSSAKQHDYYTQYLASNRMSWEIFHQDKEGGLSYAKEAYRLYEQLGEENIRNKILLILRVEDCFRYLGKIDSAAFYLKEALTLSERSKDKNLLGSTYSSISKIYRSFSVPDSALYFAKLAWEITDRKEPANYSYLASCYMDVDSLDQAKQLFRCLLNFPANYYSLYNAYNGLFRISMRQKDYARIEIYSDSAQYMLKKIYQSSEADNQSYRIDKQELNDRNNKLDIDLNTTKYQFIVYILISLLVIASICFSFYLFRMTAKKRMMYEKLISGKLLEQEKHRHELEEIQFMRQKELLEMQHNQNQEKHRLQLESLEKQLFIMKRYIISKMQHEQDLDKLKKEKKIHDLKSEDWLELEVFLNDSALGFMSSFRESFPNLKESDFQLCMLLKLDFNNQDLTRFYGIRPDSIKHKLLLLKSKLGIEKSFFSAREYIKMWSIKKSGTN